MRAPSTGQQIHATNLVTMWSEYLDFDTRHDGPGSTIKKLLSNTSTPTSRCRHNPYGIIITRTYYCGSLTVSGTGYMRQKVPPW